MAMCWAAGSGKTSWRGPGLPTRAQVRDDDTHHWCRRRIQSETLLCGTRGRAGRYKVGKAGRRAGGPSQVRGDTGLRAGGVCGRKARTDGGGGAGGVWFKL
eukprot:2609073-Rhodomonas_salina.1